MLGELFQLAWPINSAHSRKFYILQQHNIPNYFTHLEYHLYHEMELEIMLLKVNKNRKQIFQPKPLPKIEPSNFFFYPDK